MIGTHIEIILIVTGATTAMALAQFIAPASVSRIIYGAAPTEVVGIALVLGAYSFFWSGYCSSMRHFILQCVSPSWLSPRSKK
jgi:hypothetical protein